MMDFSGATVATLGRLRLAPRWRIATELARRGGALTNRMSKAQGLLVGHGAYTRLDAVSSALAEADRRGLWCASERRILRALDLVEEAPEAPRSLDAEALARHSGLAPEIVRLLAIFDIIDDGRGSFDIRDLIAARQTHRLLSGGASLTSILGAALAARERGVEDLLVRSQLRLSADGQLALSIGDYSAEFDGQMRLPLDDAGNPSIDLLYEQAARAEEDARWHEAETTYRRIIGIAPRDAVAHFNLANVLTAEGEIESAIAALARAVALDPRFAEAWYNLAHLWERRDDPRQARQCLERAVAADNRFADAIYNLARLCLAGGDSALAAPLFERYLVLDASSNWAERARQGLQLCRLLSQMASKSER